MVQVLEGKGGLGAIGGAFGRGLADELPRVAERYQLKEGLKQFEKDSGNLNPMQQIARLSSIPGITPQMIQTMGELARVQNQGNAFKNASNKRDQNPQRPGKTNLDEANFLNQSPMQRAAQKEIGNQSEMIPSAGAVDNNRRTPNLRREEDIPQVEEGNPFNEKTLTKLPWTPEQRNSVIAGYIGQGFLPDQAKQLAADDENRDLSEPEAFKARQNEIQSAKDKARESLSKQLKLKLQKSEENIFEDVQGTALNNAERGMIRDLILNPKADIDNVANDWSERLYRMAKTKNKLKTKGKTIGLESILKGSAPTTMLNEYQDIFKRAGNLEEYADILVSDLGMSEQAAAFVAYPPNKSVKDYVSKLKPKNTPGDYQQQARKTALEIEKIGIGPDDSVLSIAKALKNKDPFFDEQAFLDQISEDKNDLGLNDRQREELGNRVRDIVPSWGDLLFLPIIRR